MAFSECSQKHLVELNQSNGVSRILLNDPHRKNALSKDMIRCLMHTLNKIANDNKQKVVVMRGSGGAFCSGADLNWMKKGLDQSDEENKNDAGLFYELFTQLYNFPKPLIIWVEKYAIGGALGLLTCADFAIAEKDVTLSFSEVKLGLVPATIAPFVVKKIGFSEAKYLMMSATIFTAKYGKKIGLINQVLPAKEIANRVDELVEQFKQNSSQAMASTKQLLNTIASQNDLEGLKPVCCDKIALARTSNDGQEGVKAFFDRRQPNWNK